MSPTTQALGACTSINDGSWQWSRHWSQIMLWSTRGALTPKWRWPSRWRGSSLTFRMRWWWDSSQDLSRWRLSTLEINFHGTATKSVSSSRPRMSCCTCWPQVLGTEVLEWDHRSAVRRSSRKCRCQLTRQECLLRLLAVALCHRTSSSSAAGATMSNNLGIALPAQKEKADHYGNQHDGVVWTRWPSWWTWGWTKSYCGFQSDVNAAANARIKNMGVLGPGLKAGISTALNRHMQRLGGEVLAGQQPSLRPLNQVALEAWKQHFLHDHLPARRDCMHRVRAQVEAVHTGEYLIQMHSLFQSISLERWLWAKSKEVIDVATSWWRATLFQLQVMANPWLIIRELQRRTRTILCRRWTYTEGVAEILNTINPCRRWTYTAGRSNRSNDFWSSQCWSDGWWWSDDGWRGRFATSTWRSSRTWTATRSTTRTKRSWTWPWWSGRGNDADSLWRMASIGGRCTECWCQEPHLHWGHPIASCEGCAASIGQDLCTSSVSWAATASHSLWSGLWAHISTRPSMDFGQRGDHNFDHGIFLQDQWPSWERGGGREKGSQNTDQCQAVPIGILAFSTSACGRAEIAMSAAKHWVASSASSEVWHKSVRAETILAGQVLSMERWEGGGGSDGPWSMQQLHNNQLLCKTWQRVDSSSRTMWWNQHQLRIKLTPQVNPTSFSQNESGLFLWRWMVCQPGVYAGRQQCRQFGRCWTPRGPTGQKRDNL